MIDSNDSQKRIIDSNVKSYKGTIISLALLIILIIVYLLLPQAKEAREDNQGIILKGVYMNWVLIAILASCAFAILYLLMKPIKKHMKNKTAFWIGFYISLITLLSFVILAIVIQVCQFTWYGDDTTACVIGVVGHILLIYLPCYLFVRKKATQPFQEDFLVPEWFKRKFYPIIKNKLCLRLLLVFLFYPIYVLLTIPWIGLFSLLLVVPIAVLLALSLVVSWIYSGKKEKL